MIVVKNGFTMSEHAPITYNYRYQSTPSPVSRTNIFPLSQNDPPNVLPAATTDTGALVYLASQITRGTLVGSTELEFYMAWNSSAGANKLVRVINRLGSDGKYYMVDYAHDERQVDYDMYSSDTPIILALCTTSINMPYMINSAHAFDYNTDSGNNAVTVAYQRTIDGNIYTGTRFFYANYRRYNRVRLAAGSHTQQEQVYAVTGGIVR